MRHEIMAPRSCLCLSMAVTLHPSLGDSIVHVSGVTACPLEKGQSTWRRKRETPHTHTHGPDKRKSTTNDKTRLCWPLSIYSIYIGNGYLDTFIFHVCVCVWCVSMPASLCCSLCSQGISEQSITSLRRQAWHTDMKRWNVVSVTRKCLSIWLSIWMFFKLIASSCSWCESRRLSSVQMSEHTYRQVCESTQLSLTIFIRVEVSKWNKSPLSFAKTVFLLCYGQCEEPVG